jgi:hypothetical protein
MQKRLDMFTRKKSNEELNHKAKLERQATKIKEQRRSIQDKESRLRARQENQQKTGRRTAEKIITEKLIKSKIAPLRDFLSVLESNFIALKERDSSVKKESAKQTDIFN